MEREQIELALVAAIEADDWLRVWGYSRNELAAIAFRRWHSFSRRNKSKHPTEAQRINDLAKGIQEHFEPSGCDGPSGDFVYFAEVMAPILKSSDAGNC